MDRFIETRNRIELRMHRTKCKNRVLAQRITFIAVLMFVLNISACYGEQPADSWLLFTREARKLFRTCPTNDTKDRLNEMWTCVKSRSLEIFDRYTALDTIPLTSNIQLIRDYTNRKKLSGQMKKRKKIDHETDGRNISWIDHVMNRTMDVFSTHYIRIDVHQLTKKDDVGEARVRHRVVGNVVAAIFFGMALLGLITIPLSFQLMTIVGGTALIFAKMAMLMGAMSGLKRLASTGVHYGLYHTDPLYHHGHWDRVDEDHPTGHLFKSLLPGIHNKMSRIGRNE